MAKLKATLGQKSEFDALPEAVRAFYVAADDGYVLDVDGMTLNSDVDALNTKLAEFRDNNRRLHGDVKRYEGIDPDKYRSMESELTTLRKGGIKGPDDIQAAIQQAVAQAVNPLQQQLDSEKKARAEKEQALAQREFEDAAWQYGAKAGVEEWAKPFYLQKVASVFKRNEQGQLVAEQNGQPVYSKRRNNITNPMSIEEFTTEILPTEAPGLFKASHGTGEKPRTPGEGGGGRPGVISMESWGNNIEKIAKGEVTVLGATAR